MVALHSPSANDAEEAQPHTPMERLGVLRESPSSPLPVWAQAGEAPPGQQALLKILANHSEGLDRNAWQHTSNLDPTAFDAALEALKNHDVVTDENGICCYSVELMRRWVAAQHLP